METACWLEQVPCILHPAFFPGEISSVLRTWAVPCVDRIMTLPIIGSGAIQSQENPRVQFAGSHILSVQQFQRDDVERIFAVADDMRPYAQRRRITRVLEGA